MMTWWVKPPATLPTFVRCDNGHEFVQPRRWHAEDDVEIVNEGDDKCPECGEELYELEPAIGRCVTCKWWNPLVKDPTKGSCALAESVDGKPVYPLTDFYAEDMESYHARLITKQHFSCNQWNADDYWHEKIRQIQEARESFGVSDDGRERG